MQPNHKLGVTLMDEDHEHLEALFGRVAETADADLPAFLGEAETATRAHFEREESLMQSAGVPIFHCHAAQHKLLLAEFAGVHNAAGSGDMAGVRRFLGESFPSMIAAHVDSVDRVTASFLKSEISEQTLGVLRLPCE